MSFFGINFGGGDETATSPQSTGSMSIHPSISATSSPTSSYRVSTGDYGEREMSQDEVNRLVHDALRRARRATNKGDRSGGSAVNSPMTLNSPMSHGSRVSSPSTIASTSISQSKDQQVISNYTLNGNLESMLGGSDDTDHRDMHALLSPTMDSLDTFTTHNSADDVIRKVEEEIAAAKRAAEEANKMLDSRKSWADTANPLVQLSPTQELAEILDDHLADDEDLHHILCTAEEEEMDDDGSVGNVVEACLETARSAIEEDLDDTDGSTLGSVDELAQARSNLEQDFAEDEVRDETFEAAQKLLETAFSGDDDDDVKNDNTESPVRMKYSPPKKPGLPPVVVDTSSDEEEKVLDVSTPRTKISKAVTVELEKPGNESVPSPPRSPLVLKEPSGKYKAPECEQEGIEAMEVIEGKHSGSADDECPMDEKDRDRLDSSELTKGVSGDISCVEATESVETELVEETTAPQETKSLEILQNERGERDEAEQDIEPQSPLSLSSSTSRQTETQTKIVGNEENYNPLVISVSSAGGESVVSTLEPTKSDDMAVPSPVAVNKPATTKYLAKQSKINLDPQVIEEKKSEHEPLDEEIGLPPQNKLPPRTPPRKKAPIIDFNAAPSPLQARLKEHSIPSSPPPSTSNPSPLQARLKEHSAPTSPAPSTSSDRMTRRTAASTGQKIEFRYPYPYPPPLQKPRAAKVIIKANSLGYPDSYDRWTKPSSDLKQLVSAGRDQSLQRRSNAWGALKVLSNQKKNQRPMARVSGLLESLTFTVAAPIPGNKDFEIAQDARGRAITTLLNLTDEKDNRAVIVTYPGLLEALIKIIESDDGECRSQTCAIMAKLAKTAKNREYMIQVGGLLVAVADIMMGGPADDIRSRGFGSGSFSGEPSFGDSCSDMSSRKDTPTSASSLQLESIRSNKDSKHDAYLNLARVNACAALTHLSRHCAISNFLAQNPNVMRSVVSVSREFENPIHTKCLEIIFNLTRFASNASTLARNDDLIETLLKCGKSKLLEDRVWCMRSFQNLTGDSASKVLLANGRILTLLSICSMRKDTSEQGAAVAALYNLSTEPGAVVPLTNTRNVVATLVHLAHSAVSEPEIRQMACDALATIGLWLQTLAGSGTVPDGVKKVLLPSHTTTGWQRWD